MGRAVDGYTLWKAMSGPATLSKFIRGLTALPHTPSTRVEGDLPPRRLLGDVSTTNATDPLSTSMAQSKTNSRHRSHSVPVRATRGAS